MMNVLIRRTNGDFFIFSNVTEVSKTEDYLRVRVVGMSRIFQLDTILELKVDGKDVCL